MEMLNFKQYGTKTPHLIILHGLLGSLDNWQSIARSLAEHCTVWTIDQRNHGRSFHSDRNTYPVMADDLKTFIRENKIDKPIILGHSMGGKVAMTFALAYPEMLSSLIVADIGPCSSAGDHESLFEAMMALPVTQLEDRKQAYEFLREQIHSEVIVQFLLKNLGRDSSGFFWKPNLKVLFANYDHLMAFDDLGRTNNGPTTFIKGERSNYIKEEDWPIYLRIFPHASLKIIPDAGHWLHAEQPELFIQAVLQLIK